MSQPSLYPKHLKTLAIAAVVFAATSSMTTSNAQTDGSVTFNAQISSNTCVLKISDSVITGTSTVSTTRVVSLGDFSPASVTNYTVGGAIGSSVDITLALQTSTTNTASCSLAGNGNWNVALDVAPSQIGAAGSRGVIVNGATTSAATGVALGLWTVVNNSPTTIQNLSAGGSGGDTKLSTNSVTATSSIVFKAQLVTTSASAPVAGLFSANIPLAITYF